MRSCVWADFDASFAHAEDAELGVRLEKDGARFYLSDGATSVHSSDRASVDGWRRRARTYGACDSRIARKHPEVLHANPWRYFDELSPASRPWLALGVALPEVGAGVASAVLHAAAVLDRACIEQPALRATTLAFGLEYARGLREEVGALDAAVSEWLGYLRRVERAGTLARVALASLQMRRAILEDHATLRRYSAKYGGSTSTPSRDAVVRIGFQLMVAVRAMHFFRDTGATGAAMVTSRLIRHLYGADIHWEADIAPGVQIVHGMGIAISPKAHVGKDTIIFQNVTLGESSNGAPDVGRGVHIGPGATLLGPIHVGDDKGHGGVRGARGRPATLGGPRVTGGREPACGTALGMSVHIGRVPIDPVSFSRAIEAVGELVLRKQGGTVFTPNVDHVVMAERDEAFREAYEAAPLRLIDGMPVVWAARALGCALPEKVSGSDFIPALLDVAREKAWRVYLLGGAPGSVERAAATLAERGVDVVGAAAPRIDIDDDDGWRAWWTRSRARSQTSCSSGSAHRSRSSSPTARRPSSLRPAVLIGVGATIDFLAGTVPRAPAWMSTRGARVGLPPRARATTPLAALPRAGSGVRVGSAPDARRPKKSPA